MAYCKPLQKENKNYKPYMEVYVHYNVTLQVNGKSPGRIVHPMKFVSFRVLFQLNQKRKQISYPKNSRKLKLIKLGNIHAYIKYILYCIQTKLKSKH